VPRPAFAPLRPLLRALPLVAALSFVLDARAAGTPASTAPVAPSSASSSSSRPTPQDQLFFRTTDVLRYNPLGLITDNVLSFRHRLFLADDSALLRDNFVGLGVTPQVSAAFARVGLLAEVQPLSVLRLWANAELVGYFGTFGLLQSFEGPNADFRDATISERGRLPDGDPAKNAATTGTQLTLGADVQLKVGPVALRNLARLVRGSYRIRPGDTVYYDQFYDVLAPNDGWFAHNDTDLLYMTDFGLVAGLRTNVTMPFYDEVHYSGAERAAGALTHGNGPTLRTGPLVAYTFFDDPAALWNRPTVLVIANWWLAHRYRTGFETSQFIPYVVVGFQMTTDLLPHLSPRASSSTP
jgi:hypothetical protein